MKAVTIIIIIIKSTLLVSAYDRSVDKATIRAPMPKVIKEIFVTGLDGRLTLGVESSDLTILKSWLILGLPG